MLPRKKQDKTRRGSRGGKVKRLLVNTTPEINRLQEKREIGSVELTRKGEGTKKKRKYNNKENKK